MCHLSIYLLPLNSHCSGFSWIDLAQMWAANNKQNNSSWVCVPHWQIFFPPRLSQLCLNLFLICKDPKIALQLCVPAGIRPHDSVRSAWGMQQQALGFRLDAYQSSASPDWMLIITIACCQLTEWPLQYQPLDAIWGRGGSDATFSDAVSHLPHQTCEP